MPLPLPLLLTRAPAEAWSSEWTLTRAGRTLALQHETVRIAGDGSGTMQSVLNQTLGGKPLRSALSDAFGPDGAARTLDEDETAAGTTVHRRVAVGPKVATFRVVWTTGRLSGTLDLPKGVLVVNWAPPAFYRRLARSRARLRTAFVSSRTLRVLLNDTVFTGMRAGEPTFDRIEGGGHPIHLTLDARYRVRTVALPNGSVWTRTSISPG